MCLYILTRSISSPYTLHPYLIFLYTTDKEYQQRRLLDGFVSGIKINFEYKEQSLMLEGSIENFRVWDPDMSKTTSDRNRHLIRLIDCDRNGEDDETNFFSFRYRAFKTLHIRQNEHESLPDWIEKKIVTGDIDDYLTAKIRPLEFIYLRERTAEIADYLNNGLPGETCGYTPSSFFTGTNLILYPTRHIE